MLVQGRHSSEREIFSFPLDTSCKRRSSRSVSSQARMIHLICLYAFSNSFLHSFTSHKCCISIILIPDKMGDASRMAQYKNKGKDAMLKSNRVEEVNLYN